MPAPVTIRSVERPEERAQFFHLAAQTFVRDVPVEVAAPDWQRFATGHPCFTPADLRGAFQDGVYVGGYFLEERLLRIGAARVPAGRIGAVVIHPEHRRQGIGTALMRDALVQARARGLTVLLLNGAAHFYDPFGYVDIFDRTDHLIARADIQAQEAGPYHVRRAMPADALALLELYTRHHAPYPGSYARTLDEQAYLLRFGQTVKSARYPWRDDIGYDLPALAVDARDRPRGYLAVPWGAIRSFGVEVACDDWPATLALLHHHAGLLSALPGAPDHVRWPLPPTSAARYALADHLPVISETRQRPHAGWMASPVDVPALARCMLPEWQERWQRRPVHVTGTLVLSMEDDGPILAVDGDDLHPARGAPARASEVRLSRAAFIQLLFGYRPVAWAADQDGMQIPLHLLPALEALFPARHSWIAPTDGC